MTRLSRSGGYLELGRWQRLFSLAVGSKAGLRTDRVEQIVWLPALAGRLWLPLNFAHPRAPHASFRLKPEATSTHQQPRPFDTPIVPQACCLRLQWVPGRL